MDATLKLPLLQFDNLPVLVALRGVGLKFLAVSLVAWLVCEVFRLRQGACDFVSPIVRVGIATVALTMLPTWGNGLYQLALHLSDGIGADIHQEVFTRAIAKAAESAASSKIIGTGLGYVFCAFLVCLTAVKMFIVDLLFPCMFAIVLIMGLVGIPIGIFPGINSVGGWIRSLIEISLWPVCYQLVVATLTSLWKGMLDQVAAADFTTFFSDMVSLAAQNDVAEAFASSQYFLLIQLFAFLALFTVLTLFSPAIATIIMRSQPAGFVGGIMTAKASSLAIDGAKLAVRKAFGNDAAHRYADMATSAAGKAAGKTTSSSGGEGSHKVPRGQTSYGKQEGDEMDQRDLFESHKTGE